METQNPDGIKRESKHFLYMGLERTVFRMVQKVNLKLVVDAEYELSLQLLQGKKPANQPNKTDHEKKFSL